MYSIASDLNKQLTFFNRPLLQQLNPYNKYCALRDQIPWAKLEETAKDFYSEQGRSVISFRLLLGLEIVKNLENLSDERTIDLYMQSPYVQYFCGEAEFQTEEPCSNAMLSIFRKRTGETIAQAIFEASVAMHGVDAMEEDVVLDTTCQPKNITYPTDTKLLCKVISRCWRIAEEENIKLNNTYAKELKGLLRTIRFEKGKEQTKEVKKARKRLRTICGILVRELKRKLDSSELSSMNESFSIFEKVLEQSKETKNKTAAEKNAEIKGLVDIIDACLQYAENYGIDVNAEKYQNKTEEQVRSYNEAKGRGRERGYTDAKSGLKKTANHLIKQLEKKLNKNQLSEIHEDISSFKKILEAPKQERRIYSIHEPQVVCITKGKAGKKHEYGSKASIAITKQSGVIVGAVNYVDNKHDSDTVADTVNHVAETRGEKPKRVFCDRGYRGAQEKNPDIEIHIPSAPKSDATEDDKVEARKNFGRRSSIEPVIGHVKNDFRLARTYLKGHLGDVINLLLACSAYNFKKWYNKQVDKWEEEKKAKQKAA